MLFRTIKNKQLVDLLTNMMNAKNQSIYDANYTEFVLLASREQIDYFTENWENCLPKWVKYFRITNSNTNKYVESINGKLKMNIKKNSRMSDCWLGIFRYLDKLKLKYYSNSYNSK